ncbi:MGMT family protein [Actinorugispora endophytica]|uniref:O(6)-alkylguanine repair protein YbaZ n=1 Tax=Actinorugispora endophytica TaxID=1605990 RepID=A0A4R6V7M5_9ACTN|nr:MGMT family protein [Actinorugispora endophytica]TDQ54728.1 O(6)-alkylguanine repair protein YbaZ [Actinorugispora endophytica]
MPQSDSRPDEYAERVLEIAERIPPGRVMSYGDVAEYLGEGGPRQVGAVMSAWGGGVPWWRVIRADGSPPPGHEVRARAHYAAEATPLRPGSARVDMARARWDGGAATPPSP